jgi:hypothetical protein
VHGWARTLSHVVRVFLSLLISTRMHVNDFITSWWGIRVPSRFSGPFRIAAHGSIMLAAACCCLLRESLAEYDRQRFHHPFNPK